MPNSQRGWLARPHSLPRSLHPWLCDKSSLTRRLKSRCAAFRVVLLSTGLKRPNVDETALLQMAPGARAYVREVLLLCDEVPVVFAHSVLPYPSLRGAWNGISRLGSRPLGEALFSDRRIHRQPLSFRNLHPDHPLFHSLAQQHPPGVNQVWAHRSLFCLNSHPLLVTEVFLPTIVAL